MNEPKMIYKYTHAQAVADGELRIMPYENAPPMYISKALDKQAEKYGITDDDILGAVLVMFFGTKPKPRVTIHSLKPFNFDMVTGAEIRDDHEYVACLTFVCEGES